MSKFDILLMAWQNLLRRKVRTALTVLGVLIGTTSIVVMISLGIGLKESLTANMAQWGSLNEITINSYIRFDEDGNPMGDSKALNDDAIEELRSLPGVVGVTPVYEIGGEASWGKLEGYMSLVGIDPSEMSNFEFTAYRGRLLEDQDRFNLVVGGQVGYNFYDPNKAWHPDDEVPWEDRLKDEYNPTLKMIDERIAINTRNYNTGKSRKFNFNVVGMLDPQMMDKSWSAYVPLDELKEIRKFVNAGTNTRPSKPKPGEPQGPSPDDYDTIWVKSESIDRTKELSQEIKDLGYQAWSMADNLEGIEDMSRTIQAVLGGIGAITLLVAAIGIINTMIMSIYERTREIGVMKVIGASFSDVRLLFLTEAGLIGLAGGVVGLGFSYSLSFLVNKFAAGMTDLGMGGGPDVAISLIPPWLALFSLVFSFMIGLLAGIYPANRAVKISPIEAIRTS